MSTKVGCFIIGCWETTILRPTFANNLTKSKRKSVEDGEACESVKCWRNIENEHLEEIRVVHCLSSAWFEQCIYHRLLVGMSVGEKRPRMRIYYIIQWSATKPAMDSNCHKVNDCRNVLKNVIGKGASHLKFRCRLLMYGETLDHDVQVCGLVKTAGTSLYIMEAQSAICL